MRHLVFHGPGDLRWEEAPDPIVEASEAALVRPVAVAACDLDGAMVRGLAPAPAPFPFGHECVAEVVETGGAVATVRAGDRVVVPFQINCGTCDACVRGRTGACESYRGTPMYGFGSLGGDHGGVLADLVAVPHADAMLVPLPAGVEPAAAASAADNIPDALRTVLRPLRTFPDAAVLVVGGGAPSIGLYAVGLAMALGASSVTYIDEDSRRLAVAEGYGARVFRDFPAERIGRYPVTVDASARPDGLRFVLERTSRDGIATSVGIYFGDTPVPMFDMYVRGVTFHTGRPHARALIPEVVDLIASGRFDPRPVAASVVPWEEAGTVFADPPGKVVAVRE
jgi:alcohol dehydrogenase